MRSLFKKIIGPVGVLIFSILPVFFILGFNVQPVANKSIIHSSKTKSSPVDSAQLTFTNSVAIEGKLVNTYTFKVEANEKIEDNRQGYYWEYKNPNTESNGKYYTFVLDNILNNKFGDESLNILSDIRPSILSISVNLAISAKDEVIFTSGAGTNNFWNDFTALNKIDVSGFNSLKEIDLDSLRTTSPATPAEVYLSGISIKKMVIKNTFFRKFHFNSGLKNNVTTDLESGKDVTNQFFFYLPYKNHIDDKKANQFYEITGASIDNVIYDTNEGKTNLIGLFVVVGIVGFAIVGLIGYKFKRHTI